ncbi:HlyD family secretion protein [Dyella flagellata]|uniref:Secretion protein n=1 Tax=Dyella flagellata TaxID=1867833 RepID=A0ABQ5XK90_9GAMM|nr:HlyD family secretion protein [Dyella flagellata]GLQ90915.1 secretion protein [Dyella flagellata]
MDTQLFRKDALEAQATSWLGGVHLSTPVSYKMWAMSAVLFTVSVVSWLVSGHYTRRVHVTGSLVPRAGLIDVVARSSGIVARVHVKEGQAIRVGDVLLVISGEHISEAVGETNAAVSRQLLAEKQSLQTDIGDTQAISDAQASSLRIQQATLQGELGVLVHQIATAQAKASSYLDVLDRMRPLEAKGYVSRLQIQQEESQALEARSEVDALIRQKYETTQQLNSSFDQLAKLPLDTHAKLNELRRKFAQAELQLAQNEADRSIEVRATQAGMVSSLTVKQGQAVSAGQSMLAVVPDGSQLEAQLLVPSAAIGFITPGTKVALHYQAFPYQKFGVQHGTVRQLSASALKPNEVTVLMGRAPPSEAMYHVDVELASQTVDAYGLAQPLKSNMALDADLLLERRRVIEWLLEPLYGIRRRSEGAS